MADRRSAAGAHGPSAEGGTPPNVLVESERRDGTTVVLTLARPETRNSLSEAMLAALQAAIDAASADPGVRAIVIAGKGPADLLTLRAVRALGAADVLVLDGDADPEVVKMARRDVERVDPARVDADHLIQLAREGRQIVRLITHAVDPTLVHALTQAEVAVEVLPAAS